MYNISSYGRLCLFGEHSDWASEFAIYNGYSITMPLEQGFSAKVEKSDKFILISSIEKSKLSFGNDEIIEVCKKENNYYRYCCASAYVIKQKFNIDTNVKIELYNKNLPIKSGLSSSSAICLLVIQSFNLVYQLNLSKKEIAQFSCQSENLTGSGCGMLDQIGIYPPNLYLMKFQHGNRFYCKSIIIQGEWNFFYVILGNEKKTSEILSELKSSYKTNIRLQQHLGFYNRKIILEAMKAFLIGDNKMIGELMNLSQKNFDNYIVPCSINNLFAPKLHTLINDSYIKNKILGCKEVGSHGDGTALLLAKNFDCKYDLITYIQKKYGFKCFSINIFSKGEINA